MLIDDLVAAARACPDQGKVDAALRFALRVIQGQPARPAPPPCHWRGPLLERCPCGDPLRDVWECSLPATLIDGQPAKATGKLCANCRHAAPAS